ncbi:MAG: heparinase, partial [Candidatus Krumholzibacteria bacterium]|nr:heparinase [Candidatus Krumholzibacteria bacterium]
MSLPLYFRTIRYLRPIQIYGRVARRLYSAPIDSSPPPAVRPLTGEWVEAAVKEVRMLGPARFRFLNHEREVSDAEAWNDPEAEELWLYNLHYFEDLNAKDAGTRREWHVSLLKRWIDENPALAGAGWDPYPVSRRILNWIKWALAGNELSDELRQSLATQTRYLSKRIEIH